MARLSNLGITLTHGKALDFGCGVGRLTQALAAHFSEVHGVDISSSMVDRANAFADGCAGNLRFFHLRAGDLHAFPDFSYDFVYSHICLQHIPTTYQHRYIRGFFRVLGQGGVAFFQVVQTRGLRALVPNALADVYRWLKHRGGTFIPMYGIRPDAVRRLADESGCRVVDCLATPYRDRPSRFVNHTFCVIKEAGR